MKRLSSSVVYICIQFQNRKTNKEMFVPAMGGNPRKKKKKKKTNTQTCLYQTQLVEQSLGHKKKEEPKFIFIPAGKRVASAWFPFL
jgi:hypothetical protein